MPKYLSGSIITSLSRLSISAAGDPSLHMLNSLHMSFSLGRDNMLHQNFSLSMRNRMLLLPKKSK